MRRGRFSARASGAYSNAQAQIARACRTVCEPMEARRMLSTINWVNKGSGPGILDTDNFNAIFGANATIARAIVQRGIDDWERVITNFNGSGGRNTFDLTVDAGFLGATTAADTNVTAFDALDKPTVADITMDNDAAGGTGGWYFDPTPGTATVPDDSDFTTFVTPYVADKNGTQGRDFYRSFIHELTHAMGLSASSTRITGSEVDAGDDPNSNDVADRLKTLDVDSNGTPDFTFTTIGGRHLFEGGGTYTGPVHPNEIINPGRVISTNNVRRGLISDVVAECVGDIFDYTIRLPSTLNTFYANLNTAFNSVTVTGDMNFNGDDTDVIDLEVAGTAMSFEVNGTDETIEGAEFGAIIVNSGVAADNIDVDQLLSGKTVDINAGDGDDDVSIAPQFGDIDTDLASDVDLDGGIGNDDLFFNDSADGAGGDTYTITSPAVQKGVRVINHLLFEHLEFLLGSPNVNTWNINSTSPFYDIDILAGNTTDTFNVGNGDYDSSIFGDIHIDGYVGADVLNINDGSDAGAGDYTITATSFSKPAGGTLTYDSMGSVVVNGSDQPSTYTVDIDLPRSPVTINAGGGNDVLDVDGSGNDIDTAVWMPITFNGQNGNDLLDLNDTGDASDTDTYTIGQNSFAKSSAQFTSLTFNGTERLDLMGNGGANTIEIDEIASGMNVTLNGGDGEDLLTNTTHDINSSILGNVTLNGGAGADIVTLSDEDDADATQYTLTDVNFQVTGGPLSGVIRYNNAETFNLKGNAHDTDVNIDSTKAGVAYELRGNGGDDTFNVADASHDLDTIAAGMTIIGGPDSDALNVFDDNEVANQNYYLTMTQVYRLGGSIITPTVESIFLGAGDGNDGIHIDSVAATTVVVADGGDGGDAFFVGNGNWDANILNAVLVVGSNGTDTVSIDDAADTGNDAYMVTQNTTSKTILPTAAISYLTMEGLTLNANGGANTITVQSTFNGGTRINSNGGADSINVVGNFVGHFVQLDCGAGLDNVDVNSDAAGVAGVVFVSTQDLANLHVFTGGTAQVQPGGSNLLYMRTLTIDNSGILDLNDNDMIYDYTGFTPRTTVESWINTARNGGAWTGTTGITSTSAKNAIPQNTTLGLMESGEFKAIYGLAATFSGQPVDATSLLVKYTYYGDADFSGRVDGADYARIDANFNQQVTQGNISGWVNGDFDYNGKIDGTDYALIDAAFNSQGAPLRPASPLFRRSPLR